MRDNSGSAFPVLDEYVYDGGRSVLQCRDMGMSLRDYFARQALTGLIVPGIRINDIEYAAHISYLVADAMLAEREKNNGRSTQ